MLNLATFLGDAASNHPDREALVHDGRRLTYRELDRASDGIARRLHQLGVAPGDRVAVTCPNTPEFPVVYYGILKLGAIVVPLNVLLRRDEIAYQLRQSGAAAYLVHAPDHAEWLAEAEAAAADSGCERFVLIDDCESDGSQGFPVHPTSPDTTAVILYTSGTTGRPKGAELTHANLVLNAIAVNRQYRNEICGDVHLVALPLFHSYGATVHLNAGIAVGATLVLVSRFDASAVLELMAREQVTFFAGVPTMYWQLVRHAAAAERPELNVRIAGAGGASLPEELLREFERLFGVPVVEGYGLTETSPVVAMGDPVGTRKIGSIGRPIWGVQMRLVDLDGQVIHEPGVVGEIEVRGTGVMKRYFGMPEATAAAFHDGWLRTGDLARRDADGDYYLVDRVKDVIIRGGFNVYPREVEELLMAHPQVSLAAVRGVPHPSHGEEVKAFVIRMPEAPLTEPDLVAWARERIAAYKYPRIVEFVDALPMTATGKVAKRELDHSPFD
ncbi:long-chain-fatty-acid--CoA ligase [Amycolatopsis jejuensis]|uniref:long-chain-fatty-acid--CoA ligase n=1 Tax=Amycolatopsis jejuensis TaxID=330084 RepID=UPI0005270CD2|nr:long-chain fatty acid--CoA ligase [Amycolatopsis jejuensis]